MLCVILIFLVLMILPFFYKILFYTSARGIIHLSKWSSSVSLSGFFYIVAAWMFACCFPRISLLWLSSTICENQHITNCFYLLSLQLKHKFVSKFSGIPHWKEWWWHLWLSCQMCWRKIIDLTDIYILCKIEIFAHFFFKFEEVLFSFM